MDKNAIKKFAIWAREELIKRVSTKAEEYGISKETVVDAGAESIGGRLLSKSEIKQRQELSAKIKKDGYEQVIEEVAYTWFNRFIALRFMEVNNYLPTHVRVFTDEENAFNPQILTEALHLDLNGLDVDKVIALKQANKNEELYKYLLITQCNALSSILPRMFQKIDDYTELLFPDNVLRTGSVLEQMITLIPEEDWTDQVQIIGWLYQYYNSIPKDKVFANLKKNIKIRKEDIPAATQLFTPDWIVRYMVENSLGRTVINNLTYDIWNDDEKAKIDVLKSKWKYYLDDAPQEPEVIEQLRVLEHHKYGSGETLPFVDATFIDPCMGSGHILVYAFDVFMDIYRVQGWSDRDAVQRIIEKNIYGLDIDERASQLAYFAVMMKAVKYDPRFLRRKDEHGNPKIPQPNVYTIVESNRLDPHAVETFINGDADIKRNFDLLREQMYDAKEYGSIINITDVDFDLLYGRLDEMKDEIDLFTEVAIRELKPLFDVAYTLSRKYDAVVTNPPYMGAGGMDGKLSEYVKKYYPDSKADLFAVFIERCLNLTVVDGYQAMITQHSWMFLSSFESIRKRLLNRDLINMVHLGSRAFDEIGGEVVQTTSFCVKNSSTINYQGKYKRLVDGRSQQEKEKHFFIQKNCYFKKQRDYEKLPGCAVAYWWTNSIFGCFEQQEFIPGNPMKGIQTGKGEKYLRQWYEVSNLNIGFCIKNHSDMVSSGLRWFPLTSGGQSRKWFGNYEMVVNLKNDGADIRATGLTNFRLKDPQYYFLEGLTWTEVTTKPFTCRYLPSTILFGNGGPVAFELKGNLLYTIGLLNSAVSKELFAVLAPTMNYGPDQVRNIPFKKKNEEQVSILVTQCIDLSRKDWDSFETSWDFKMHPLLEYACYTPQQIAKEQNDGFHSLNTMEDAYQYWADATEKRFKQLKGNEEGLNRIFIEIYGLRDELASEVEDKDVTVRKADLQRDIRSFISYAVGCMFGRYSLDIEGLAYAGGEWDASKYTTFAADADNIIPICDDEYFDDDIVGRFIKFVETVYGKQTLQDNLKFIADALGGKGSPKEVIRNYFLNDFYADHVKIYQKRPIYWLFDSGKKNGFKALIYMHRYQPDTLARMRTDYVHEQQARYRTAIADLEHRIAGASTSERVKLTKQLSSLKDQEAEIRVYEEKIHHLADQMIRIDLDDGVNHNYLIFKDVLKDIGIKEKKN